MDKIKKYRKKYYWILLLVFAISGSCWLSIRAWDYLHTPVLFDYFWNETLKMYEPIYMLPIPEWLKLVFLMPTVGLMWWYSPIWFQPLYAISMIWLFWQIYVRIGNLV